MQQQQQPQKQQLPKNFDFLVENYKEICYNIQDSKSKYRKKDDIVQLMGVTKTVDPELINYSIDLGINLLGENRVQEYISKKNFYNKSAEIQFIGHLQTNKVKYIINDVTQIQSVDSLKLAKEIDKQAQKNDIIMNILVEVNVGEEQSKSGILFSDVYDLVNQIDELTGVKVNGLMAIPPINAEEKLYARLEETFLSLKDKNFRQANMNVLSVGMSGDYEKAIKYGSNLIRIGTKLYGARKYMEV